MSHIVYSFDQVERSLSSLWIESYEMERDVMSCLKHFSGASSYNSTVLWFSIFDMLNIKHVKVTYLTDRQMVISNKRLWIWNIYYLSIIRHKNNLCVFFYLAQRPRWATVHPDNWTGVEVVQWLQSVALEMDLNAEAMNHMSTAFGNINGQQMKALSRSDFLRLNSEHGHQIFSLFSNILKGGKCMHFILYDPTKW